MIFINLLAAVAILVSIGERLSWARYAYIPIRERTIDDHLTIKSTEFKENTSAYYYILVAFLLVFTASLVFAEFRNKWIRRTFGILDTKFGRGFFIIFIGLMIP